MKRSLAMIHQMRIAIILVSAFTSSLSFAQELNGIAVSKNHTYPIYSGQMMKLTCKPTPEYHINPIGNSQVAITNNNIGQKITNANIYDTTYKGVRVKHYQVPRFPWSDGTVSSISIFVPLARNYELTLGRSGICADAGHAPGGIRILIDPRKRGSLDNWLAINNSEISKEDLSQSIQNYFWIDVPSGYEQRLLDDLQSQAWVIDARRSTYAAGPDIVFLSFPLGSIVSKETSQTDLKNRIYNILRNSFGSRLKRSDIHAKRGYSYGLEINAPANAIISDNTYRNRWLITTVIFEATNTGDIDGPRHDRIVISIRDGLLPVWPEDRSSPPPRSHAKEFHLTPYSDNEMENFRVLEKLQTLVANKLAAGLNGEVEFDPYGG